ncbi:MAG: HDOD domain-containing protein [Gemmatimonadales bacterium]|nr:HDOD domain-containing protein [Gemmatimonadales bacterium]
MIPRRVKPGAPLSDTECGDSGRQEADRKPSAAREGTITGTSVTSEIFVARQPILDRQQAVVGYELLFQSGLGSGADGESPDQASFEMLHTVLLGFGLDALLGDKLGFVKVAHDVLMQELYLVLPRERTVLELVETVEPSAEVLEACRALKSAGYRLALDDFVRRPALAPMADLADLIKVDWQATTEAERRALVREFAPRKVQLVAEGVETREAFAAAVEEGFTLYQGYFFCEPELLRTPDVPAFKRNCVQFMTELHRPELDFDRLERVIKQEVALAVKLLRYLNSAGFGWRHEVTSIKHALRVLGERAARKWCSLIALTVLGSDKPSELVVTSLVRAQFLEQVGREAGLGSRDMDLFLTGLLSTLDSLLGQPMEEALAHMPVSNEIRHTLCGRRTSLSAVWALALAYERGQWGELKELAEQADVSVGRLPGLYRNSVQWVNRIFRG